MQSMERPVGPLVSDGKSAQSPLLRYEGKHVILERLESRHAKSLWPNIKDDKSAWDYMPHGPFDTENDFQQYIDKMSTIQDLFLYAIISKSNTDNDVIGHISMMRFDVPNRVVELGMVLYSSKIQRTTAATEVFYLIMKASFEQVNSRRLEWKTNAFNTPSRKAALRLGFTFEGIFRNHMIIKGRSRDSAWFSIIEEEWPAKKKALEAWLSSENFDGQNRQRRTLADLMTNV